jgi:hypothetical protein
MWRSLYLRQLIRWGVGQPKWPQPKKPLAGSYTASTVARRKLHLPPRPAKLLAKGRRLAAKPAAKMDHKLEAKKLLSSVNSQVEALPKTDREKVLDKLRKRLTKQVSSTKKPQPIGFRQAIK